MKHPKIWGIYALDLIFVIAFAALGRSTHHDDVFGAWGSKLWTTAWPFVVALTFGWIVLRAWRAPSSLITGLGLLAITVIAGLALRGVTGGGLALPFVLVATGTLATLLIGWRALRRVVTSLKTS